MAQILATHDRLLVRLTGLEKALGLLRDLDVPRSAVAEVEVVADGLAATRGMRALGLAWPWRRKIGTWRRRGGWRAYVSVRRGQPAVRLTLTGQGYAEVLVGADDAATVADVLRSGRVSPA